MMVRTQISLPPHELQEARERAGELGISLAELVRRALRKELTAKPESGISGLIGMIKGPVRDTGQTIDEDVGDFLNEEYERWQADWPKSDEA